MATKGIEDALEIAATCGKCGSVVTVRVLLAAAHFHTDHHLPAALPGECSHSPKSSEWAEVVIAVDAAMELSPLKRGAATLPVTERLLGQLKPLWNRRIGAAETVPTEDLLRELKARGAESVQWTSGVTEELR